ncbi:MAG: retroviral-like aspartic protease family protein [Deltaproteobacteria bacterium]|nr:retroviral-like aspartic protease family protein [Deltaproteobacteria bacterium]
METIKLTNFGDVEDVHRGLLGPEGVRSLEVEALVDTGATMLVLPAEICKRLGLRTLGKRKVRYANGAVAQVPWAGGVWLEVCGRQTLCEALVEAPGTTPLIGQIPIEALDLVVDPKSRSLHPNPASPDAPLLDLLSAA